MLPANQSLSADNSPCADINLGQVTQHKLSMLKTLTNILKAGVISSEGTVLFEVEEVVAVFAREFGLVHGLIGLTQELVGFDGFGLGERRSSPNWP